MMYHPTGIWTKFYFNLEMKMQMIRQYLKGFQHFAYLPGLIAGGDMLGFKQWNLKFSDGVSCVVLNQNY